MKKTINRGHLLLIILIHVAGWCLLFFLPVLLYPVRINDNWFYTREIADKSILIILFYANYYLLIPRLFEQKKYLAYTGIIVLAFILYIGSHMALRFYFMGGPDGPMVRIFNRAPVAGDTLMPPVVFRDFVENGVQKIKMDTQIPLRQMLSDRGVAVMGQPTIHMGMLSGETMLFGIPKPMVMLSFNRTLSSFVLMLLMGGFIRLAYSFIRNQNEKKALENANLNAEVNFLKSQINPHFLFNTLNSIYAQAHSRSENTEFSILKLSELLRYVLYDSGAEKVELTRDIQYINNYIDLQRLRLSNRIQLDYAVEGNLDGLSIAPMLLISFIENAFKHGISYTQPGSILIHIKTEDQQLHLLVHNPLVEKDGFAPGGLGLKNVTRRLALLYPGRHTLDIIRTPDTHIVNLKLDLSHA
ncbi:MAG: histidine kinase [Chitinophagaceae bacterium]